MAFVHQVGYRAPSSKAAIVGVKSEWDLNGLLFPGGTYLPAGITNLHTGLTNVNRKYFTPASNKKARGHRHDQLAISKAQNLLKRLDIADIFQTRGHLFCSLEIPLQSVPRTTDR
eukprot:gb/GECG01014796.1/.p1 GENE.gb/GECG01014796.1/~~gb/GECG01014796.1/.p1  ORF type:complete len:115 (+),score=5.20 gb/GECG01014796.1/:1-345(+)